MDLFEVGSEVTPKGYQIMSCLKHTYNSFIYLVSLNGEKSVLKYVRPRAPRSVTQGERMANNRLRGFDHLLTGEVFNVKGSIAVVMPYCSGSDLDDFIRRTRLNIGDVRMLSYQVLCGLDTMHERGMIHRDVKLQNVLVDDSRGLVAYLGDFGTTAWLDDMSAKFEIVGTKGYQAPELLRLSNEGYNEKVDMWAFGVMLYMMVAQTKPFKGDKEVCEGTWDREQMANRFNGKDLPDLLDLLELLFSVDPERRLSASDAKEHPFYRDIADVTQAEVKRTGMSMISDAMVKGQEASYDDMGNGA